MRYNIHLWQLDETGHWTKYAVGRKPDGSVTNERDTEATNPPLTLIDARFGFGIPTAETARLTISVFNGIVRELLPTAETRKTVNESGGINIDAALSLLNPTPPIQGGDTFAEGMGGCFISKLLSYPRFITPKGKIEIGGVDYLDLWQDNKPLPHNRFTTPEEILAEERRKRGGFDETVAMFCDTVKWIGESTRTSKAARCAIGKINALVRAFTSVGFADILRIDELANEAAEALQAMCEELADRKDAQATTAQAADCDAFARKVADAVADTVGGQLKPIADKIQATKDTVEAAANRKPRKDKGGKHKHTKDGWRLQAEIVGDFSKCAFKHGGKTYGAMTEEKAKDWETRYPNANKRERKSGYYSEMRRNPDLKQEYWNAAARWNEYWRTFKKDFTAWLKDNPRGTVDLFKVTWTPPGKTVAMKPTDKTLRYGSDMRFADSPDGNDI